MLNGECLMNIKWIDDLWDIIGSLLLRVHYFVDSNDSFGMFLIILGFIGAILLAYFISKK